MDALRVAAHSAPYCPNRTAADCSAATSLLRTSPRLRDVWAWVLDTNRERHQQGRPRVVSYEGLCRELTTHPAGFGPLSKVGARSALRRYSAAWSAADRRRREGARRPGDPRRKRLLMPVRFCDRKFEIDGTSRRIRLPVARGYPE